MKKCILGVFVVICVLAVIIAVLKNSKQVEVESEVTEYIPEQEITDEQNRVTIVTLYFYDSTSDTLVPEARNVDVKELMDNPYNKILEMLINGPEGVSVEKTIPEGTKVNNVTLEGENLTIDFNENFLEKYELGSKEQLNMIYSIVDTFLELKEISSVNFLVNGEQVDKINERFVAREEVD